MWLVSTIFGPIIERVEVERSTEHNVWINGRRQARISAYECYFDSFDAARSYILDFYADQALRSMKQLNAVQSHLEEVHRWKEGDHVR